jgi:hypothetical protein
MATFSQLLATVAVPTFEAALNLEVEKDDIVLNVAGDTHGLKGMGGKVHAGDRVACYQQHFSGPILLTVATEPSKKSGWCALSGWQNRAEFRMDAPVIVRVIRPEAPKAEAK